MRKYNLLLQIRIDRFERRCRGGLFHIVNVSIMHNQTTSRILSEIPFVDDFQCRSCGGCANSIQDTPRGFPPAAVCVERDNNPPCFVALIHRILCQVDSNILMVRLTIGTDRNIDHITGNRKRPRYNCAAIHRQIVLCCTGYRAIEIYAERNILTGARRFGWKDSNWYLS